MIWPFARRTEGLVFKEHGEAVPRFKAYYPTRAEMDPAQARFYEHFKREIAKGRALDVGDNVSYVFCHCYEVQASDDLVMVARCMRDLSDVYAGSAMLSAACADWAIDALIGQGRYAEARAAFRDLPLDSSGSLRTDLLLSLKMHLGERPSGGDVLTLEGPKVTRYARDHLEDVATIIDAMLDGREAHEGSVLRDWTNRFKIWRGEHHLFNGSLAGRKTPTLMVSHFSRSAQVLDECRALTREAENSLREERGVPRVGEGWVAETELYYRIKKAFPHWTVLHHGRPPWLGRQHLDVLIEEIGVALEYQGVQHFGPVAFFGGAEAFERTRVRDARKAQLCAEHGVRLVLVEDGYSVDELIAEIARFAREEGRGGGEAARR